MLSAPARAFRWLLGGLVGMLVLLALAVGGLAWRLTQGPLDITGVTRAAARHLELPVSLDQADLAWDAPTGELRLQLAGVRSSPGIAVGQARLAFPLRRLLAGTVMPRDVALQAVRVELVRDRDGRFDLGDSDAPDAAHPGDELALLDHLAAHDLTVAVDDRALGQHWEVRDAELELRRNAAGGVAGQGTATLALADITARLTAHAEQDEATTRVQASLSPVSPAAIARAVPTLKALTALDAAVGLSGQAELAPDFTLRHATLHAESGAGTALLPSDAGAVPTAFTSLSLDAQGDLAAAQLQVLRLVLTAPSGAPPSTVTVSGDLARGGGKLVGHAKLLLDRVAFADLPALWPPHVGGGGRVWVTENITAGQARDGNFTMSFEAAEDLSTAALTAIHGTLAADDVTAYWLRPVPPIEHGRATLTMDDPDALSVTAVGRQGNIQVRQFAIRITGLTVKDQNAVIAADLAGPLGDVFTLLKHPRLRLLSRHPVSITNPSGQVAAHLAITLPLDSKVQIDDITIDANGTVADTRIGDVAMGRDLTHGALSFDVTDDGLKIDGRAQLAGLPGELALDMDFRAGPPSQVVQHVSATLSGNEKQLEAAGLDAVGVLAGGVTAKVDYAERRDGQASVSLDADLHAARITTPLGWNKAQGAPGGIQARAQLEHGRLVGIDRLHAEGPGLSVQARSEVVAGRPSVLHIERGVVGRTEATGTIRFPARDGEPLGITLAGPRLDLAGRLTAKSAGHSAERRGGEAGTPLAVDLHFERVLVAEGHVVGPVSLTAVSDGRRILHGQLLSSGPEQIRASLVPGGVGRRLTASAADLGSLLGDLDLAHEIGGGAMVLDGEFDDRRARGPITGHVTLSNFRVKGAPIIGKILQGVTLYGLIDALRGPGLVFDKLDSRFSLAEDVLTVTDARAFSASLGVTAKGSLDFGRSTVDLEGTVVPAYAFNTLPGRIPLIGRLFSPERGGGTFAATYSLRGPLADPSVGINPLATLAPGVLRGLFGIFD